MAQLYDAHGIQVDQEQVVVGGKAQPMARILQAESYQVEDLLRNLLIFTIGCVGPIGGMVLMTQVGAIQALRFGFGPAMLAIVVGCGVLAALIGLFWPKPWGVVVEYDEHGFEKLCRMPDKSEADKLAQSIKQVIAEREQVAA